MLRQGVLLRWFGENASMPQFRSNHPRGPSTRPRPALRDSDSLRMTSLGKFVTIFCEWLQETVMLHRRPQGNRITGYFASWLLVLAAVATMGWAQGPTNAERKTARQFESVRRQPSLLFDFLRQMPKGGDLHNHLTGAVYAESFIRWAAQDGLCVDRETAALVPPPCDPEKNNPPRPLPIRTWDCMPTCWMRIPCADGCRPANQATIIFSPRSESSAPLPTVTMRICWLRF